MKPEVVVGDEKAFQPIVQHEAVKLVKERGVPTAQMARALDGHENVLRNWVREKDAPPHGPFRGKRVMKSGTIPRWKASAIH